MVNLTEEVQTLINETPCYVATASKETGLPNVSIKGSITAVDDHTLAFAAVDSGKTLANLEDNKNISVSIAILDQHKSYQFKGIAELIDSGPLFDSMVEKLKSVLPPEMSVKTVVQINLTEVYGV